MQIGGAIGATGGNGAQRDASRTANTEQQLLQLTYGKYRERTRAATALMTGKCEPRFLSWVRQGDNAAGMTPYLG